MSESPNSGDSPTNSKPKIPNTDDFTTKKTNHGEASVSGSGANKGRSCKGCLYYSSQFKSDSRNPLCLGLSRSLPNAPRYIVGTSEMEASKEGMILRDFKYGCVGYSIYADQKNRASDPQQSEPELPVCMGIEVLVDRKIKESLAGKCPVFVISQKFVQCLQQTNERVSALGSKLDSMIEEVRAGFAALNHKFRATPEDGASSENRESNSVSAGNKSTSPMPIFDGSEALAWLARANQYFLINKTPLDTRVDVAMLAIDGPAKPWKQLLVRRCPSLSWDKFVQELLQRFGDTITSGSCVAGNSSKYSTLLPFAATYSSCRC
ncbi:hypothetical protein SASPL_145156 [Salvia splendens]|uniref:DUF8204 domain-containing protein n=1 Tax=Salvia splendens TaxID=180675 RepID=A0A8X8WGL6_SALSN|nr:hypothetical protein SASPL_145156 [Salvia splendens]